MLVTVFVLLAVAAFVCTIASALNKCPLWIPVLLLCVIELIRCAPIGH